MPSQTTYLDLSRDERGHGPMEVVFSGLSSWNRDISHTKI